MKKKTFGFTLVELIAVITILGLIALIVYPVVNNVIKDNKEKLYTENIKRLENIAQNWSLENSNKLSKIEEYHLTLTELKQDGYITDKDIKNVKTGQNMNGYVLIRWKEISNQFEFIYTE